MTYFFIFLGFIIGILLSIWYWIFNSEPRLPANVDTLVKEVMSSDLPELMNGKSGYAQNGNVKIFYELLETKKPFQGTLLLINGLTQTLLEWQPYFYQPFLDAGYQVIRYDNRDFGMSDWIADFHNNKYTLSEMAADGVAVLNHLGIEKAHIMGNSMGGMISQTIAINHPEKVLSITSIMSTGFYYDPELTAIPKPFIRNLMKLIFRYKKTMGKIETKMKFQLGIRYILKGKGDYQLDDKMILQQAYYEIKNRNGYNSKAEKQHGYAIKKSGSRYEDLKKLNTPTLIVHGTDDTLILVSHAKKYAAMIPNSTSLILEGMGHDIPKEYSEDIIKAALILFEKAKVNLA